MKLYFAGDGYDEILKDEGNVLKSYFYIRKSKNPFDKILLDSGGFSAWSRGVEIDIDEYCRYIKQNAYKISHYFVLDDIMCHKKTRANQEYMESKGLKPIPCYHAYEPLEVLEHYCKNYDYIALGGLVPLARRKQELKKVLDGCFSIIKKYKETKVHGFGMTGTEILERYPFYSVDSTSWLGGAIRGTVEKWNKLDSKLDNFIFMDKKGEKLYRKRVSYMYQEQKKKEKYITKLWQKRGIVWE
tara:strand:+ start:7351 stop:8079 length:729 start_codon:yes stop_codon:yes gene_type:complete